MTSSEPDQPELSQPARPPAGPAPMRLGQVLDVGFRILRRRWRVMLVLSLLFAGPGALLTAATGMAFTDALLPSLRSSQATTELTITAADLERATGALVTHLAALVLAGLLTSAGALAFSAVVADDYHARPATVGGALGACVRRVPAALGFMIVTSLVIVAVMAAGLAAMILATTLLPAASVTAGGPGVFLALVAVVATVLALAYLTLRWAPAYPAMVEEGAGMRQALRRSWFLSSDNLWRIFAILVLAALTSAFGSSLLSALFSLLLVDGLAPGLGLDADVAEDIALALGTVLLAPLVPVLTAVLYFDLRARRDLPGAA